MCQSCWEEAGEPRIDNERVRRALVAVQALYEDHVTGGGLHIVTDDFNLTDVHLDWCASDGRAEIGAPWDDLHQECFDALKACTEDERMSALALDAGFWHAFAIPAPYPNL